jgi:hypothetical protein
LLHRDTLPTSAGGEGTSLNNAIIERLPACCSSIHTEQLRYKHVRRLRPLVRYLVAVLIGLWMHSASCLENFMEGFQFRLSLCISTHPLFRNQSIGQSFYRFIRPSFILTIFTLRVCILLDVLDQSLGVSVNATTSVISTIIPEGLGFET